MKKSPHDLTFNHLVRDELLGTSLGEKVLFIDIENTIREAVYPREFQTGVLQAVRKRLEDAGELKAVVHIAAISKGHRGPRTSLVEYLPDNWVYSVLSTSPSVSWSPVDEDAQNQLKKLFNNGGEN